jgi:hypothetical protein
MKDLIGLFVFVFVLTMASESFAQSFGLKAGLNLANMLFKDDDETYSGDLKMSPGFHLGATAEFPATEMFSFETGLLLSTKGFNASGENFEERLTLLYLDIPLTGKASYDMGGIKLYGVFGPYVGMGLFGIFKYEDTYDGETEKDYETIDWGSDEEKSDYKRLDFGITIGAGVEINAIQLGLSYNLGLANTSPDTEDGYKANNRVLALSVGYKFGGK